MGVIQTFDGGKGYDENAEILQWTYEDDAAGGAEDVIVIDRRGASGSGLFIPEPNWSHLVCSIKNLNPDDITWTVAPYWKGTNDPGIKVPIASNGFVLGIGADRAVDQAFPGTLLGDEEQGCVINCSKIPRGIFPVIEPTKQNIKISLLIRAIRTQ